MSPRSPRVAWLISGLLLFPVCSQAQSEPPPRMDPVIVTVTRIEQRSSEAPASVTVLGSEDIRESASQTGVISIGAPLLARAGVRLKF